jgi:hypothetical protein
VATLGELTEAWRRSVVVLVPEPKAERVAGRVEEDTNLFLGLEVGQGRTGLGGVRTRAFEIIYSDLEVHHHLLVAGPGGPGWPNVVLLGLKRQPDSASRIPDQDPVWFLDGDRPAK